MSCHPPSNKDGVGSRSERVLTLESGRGLRDGNAGRDLIRCSDGRCSCVATAACSMQLLRAAPRTLKARRGGGPLRRRNARHARLLPFPYTGTIIASGIEGHFQRVSISPLASARLEAEVARIDMWPLRAA